MLIKFKRISIANQALCFLVLMLVATTSVLYFWATENAVESELSHSRTVADMADAYRAQASKFGGFYLRRETTSNVDAVGRYLAAFEVDTKQSDGSPISYTFHQKNPFLALGDYSIEVQKSPAAAKFRMTADNYMNPANAPDLFELNALQTMRTMKTTENWVVVGGQLRYARALKATKACLTCHGRPEKAPAVVTAQYRPPIGNDVGQGYGYKEGDVVGLTSVTISHRTPLQMVAGQATGFWISASAMLFLLVLSYFVMLRGIVIPLRVQTRYAQAIAASDNLSKVKVPRFAKNEDTSHNEMHLMSHELKSVHESMRAAMELILRTSRNTPR